MGDIVRLKAKALMYECGGKNVLPKCLRSASYRSLGGDDGVAYSGTAEFEIVEMDATKGVDATLTSLKIANLRDGSDYWTTDYEELFEVSPEK